MTKRQNKFHEEVKEQKIRTFFKWFFSVLGLGVFIALACYIIFFSPVFKVRTVSVTMAHAPSSVVQYLQEQYMGRNVLFLSTNTATIKKKFPLFETVVMEKELLSSVHITIKEYPPIFLLQTRSYTYVIASNGLIYDKVNNASTTYPLPLVVSDQDDTKKMMLAKLADAIQAIEKDKGSFISAFSFTYPYDITASYADGHKVIFSLNKSITIQLEEMRQVKQGLGFGKCQKLDVRFDNIYCSS